ncbi:MAG TPA: MinD/ParA family protein [Syntrophales bacterium]|nr:MinD/ParA family protein [Syntrophales bacterium]HQM30281.1 MinD/ParA family protein [Syntrophales bacterium]
MKVGRKKKPVMVCITSGKGGVGKTFITVNLAAALAAKGKKVLVVDCDFGLANVDIMLGIRPSRTMKDVVFGGKTLRDVIVKTPGGFDLVPACSGVRDMAQLLYERIEMIKEMLLSLEGYDLVLMDTGAGMTEVVLQFNLLADRNILVINRELTCLTDAYAMIKVLYQLFGRDAFDVIVNSSMNEKEGDRIFRHLDSICRRFLGFPLKHLGSVHQDEDVPRSIMNQEILVQASPHSGIAASCASMAGILSR